MAIPENRKYTIEEFLAITEQSEERMELINGEIVFQASPIAVHQDIVGMLCFAMVRYIEKNKGKCKPFVSPFDVLLGEHMVEPDFLVICDPSKQNGKRCVGAPDWVVEVTSSDIQRDYVDKLIIYREAGVREYWIVNPQNKMVFVYFFEESLNTVSLYKWSDHIPVNIYKDAAEPLTICLEELLQMLP